MSLADFFLVEDDSPSPREEARLRLTCAALTGIIALEGSHRADLNAARAVHAADACLALLYPEPAAGEVGRG